MPSPEELLLEVMSDDGRKFTELYNVQHLQPAQLDRVSRVCISTIQRLYSMLRFLWFFLNNRKPQDQFMRGVRQRMVRVQRSVWTAPSRLAAKNDIALKNKFRCEHCK